MLLESIPACHYFPSARGQDLCAVGHPAEVASRQERAELRQQEEKQGSGLAIDADFRCLPVCSCSSRHGSGCGDGTVRAATGAPRHGVRLSPGSPSAAVLPRGLKMQVICERKVGL